MSQGFALELLDQEEHECLHSWSFEPGEITLGRSPDCSIVLRNRFVSRLHARLAWSGSAWRLTNESEQGVLIDGREVEKADLDVGDVFQLGRMGPVLRLARRQQSFDAESTIRLSPGELQILHLDTERRDREVDEVTGSEFFRDLAQRADALRRGDKGGNG